MDHGRLNPNAEAPPSQLLHLPTEILENILRHLSDFDSLFAWLQSCHRMYSVYERDRARLNTRATLSTLTKRGIELERPCLFTEVAMKDSRQPSMYLQPAFRALYHGQFSLPLNYCRALLELQHFKRYDEDTSLGPGYAWRYQVMTDEGDLLMRPKSFEYPNGRKNYHLVFLERMSDQDVMTVRTKLTQEEGVWLI